MFVKYLVAFCCVFAVVEGYYAIYGCGSYSRSDTNSAQSNSLVCGPYQMCGGVSLLADGCGSCSGDQYFRVVEQSTGSTLAANDDACSSLCSRLTYTYN